MHIDKRPRGSPRYVRSLKSNLAEMMARSQQLLQFATDILALQRTFELAHGRPNKNAGGLRARR
jgi:hypothetical protein